MRSRLLVPTAIVAAVLHPALRSSAQTTTLLSPTRDTSIGYHDNYNSANTNYNWSPHFSAFSQPGTSGGVNKGRGLIDFDLSSIAPGSTIFGAFLNLTGIGPTSSTGVVTTVGHLGQNTGTLNRVTTPWNDNTVTWNTQPTITSVNAAPVVQSSHALQNYQAIDVTALVQDMLDDPVNSHGMMFVMDDETPSRGLMFHSGLAPMADERPLLIVVHGKCDEIALGTTSPQGTSAAFTLSPNRAAPGSVVRMDLKGSVPSNASVEVVDRLGHVLDKRTVLQWPFTFPVPALAVGVYTVTLRDRAQIVLGSAPLVIQ